MRVQGQFRLPPVPLLVMTRRVQVVALVIVAMLLVAGASVLLTLRITDSGSQDPDTPAPTPQERQDLPVCEEEPEAAVPKPIPPATCVPPARPLA